MKESTNAKKLGRALLLAALIGTAPAAKAQVIGYNTCLAGFFSETRLGFPVSSTDGGYRVGGGLSAGFQLMGLPDSPWLFALAGHYQTLPADASTNAVLFGGELRASYAFALGSALDIAPFLGATIDWNLSTGGIACVPGLGCSLDLHLGSWGYLSLSPRFDCPIPLGEVGPSFGLGLGFKQLLAWDNGRPSVKPKPAPPPPKPKSAPPVPAPVAASPAPPPAQLPETTATAPEPTPAPETQPTLALQTEPELFSPDGDGKDDTLDISPRLASFSSIKSWELVVDDDHQHLFTSWSGRGEPPAHISWDGKSASGGLVNSASDYGLTMSVTEDSGRVTVGTATVTTDVLVIRDGTRYKIDIPSIVFPANSAQLGLESGQQFMEQNYKLLHRLAQILQRFPGYRITIEGNANLVNWEDPASAAAEEKNMLLPLSLERAQAVKDALVELGIGAQRITVVGRGGQNPIVPFSDKDNNWKNRRVEVLLDR